MGGGRGETDFRVGILRAGPRDERSSAAVGEYLDMRFSTGLGSYLDMRFSTGLGSYLDMRFSTGLGEYLGFTFGLVARGLTTGKSCTGDLRRGCSGGS